MASKAINSNFLLPFFPQAELQKAEGEREEVVSKVSLLSSLLRQEDFSMGKLKLREKQQMLES